MPKPPRLPDAAALCRQLADALRPRITPATALVGIHTGGVWVAQWLHAELGVSLPLGSIDVAFHRDDHHIGNGLRPGGRASQIPFDAEGAHIVIVDDVLYTGRTIRAAMNEIFDYGRPACVELAVLVDRGGRELPIAPTYCPHVLALPPAQTLLLEQDASGTLSFRVSEK
jgi:pyrimidine operon attenuation protein/uracil phosphoribosyltransferase